MSQRLVLLLIWAAGYLVSISLLLIFIAHGWMLPDNFKKDFATATAIFAPYLTPIVAFWFAKRHNPRTAPEKAEAFYVAAGLSVVFNLMVIVVIGYSFIQTGEGVIESNLDLAATIGTGLTFLAGPAIGYYFGKS